MPACKLALSDDRIEDASKLTRPLETYDLGRDPDGSDFPWFVPTGDQADMTRMKYLSKIRQEYKGSCYETATYYSPAAGVAKTLMNQAPTGAELMVFWYQEACGTLTFQGEAEAYFFSRKPDTGP